MPYKRVLIALVGIVMLLTENTNQIELPTDGPLGALQNELLQSPEVLQDTTTTDTTADEPKRTPVPHQEFGPFKEWLKAGTEWTGKFDQAKDEEIKAWLEAQNDAGYDYTKEDDKFHFTYGNFAVYQAAHAIANGAAAAFGFITIVFYGSIICGVLCCLIITVCIVKCIMGKKQ